MAGWCRDEAIRASLGRSYHGRTQPYRRTAPAPPPQEQHILLLNRGEIEPLPRKDAAVI